MRGVFLALVVLLLLAGCAQKAGEEVKAPETTPTAPEVEEPKPEAPTPPEEEVKAPEATPTAPEVEEPKLGGFYTGFKKLSYGEWAEWKTDLTPVLRQLPEGEELPEAMVLIKRSVYLGERSVDGEVFIGIEEKIEKREEVKGKVNVSKYYVQTWYSKATGEVAAVVERDEQGTRCSLSAFVIPPSFLEGFPANQTSSALMPESIAQQNYSLGTFTTETGKEVRIVKLDVEENGMKVFEVWVSSDVPFGVVKAPSFEATFLIGLLIGLAGVNITEIVHEELVDFGTGEQPEISLEEAEICIKKRKR